MAVQNREQRQRQREELRRRELRRKRNRQRRMRGFCLLLLVFACGVAVGYHAAGGRIRHITAELTQEENASTPAEVAQTIALEEQTNLVVEAPQPYSDQEVLQKLAQLSGQDQRYADILASQSLYPQKLLADLINNPEMLQFVSHYPKLVKEGQTGALTKEELKEACPLFLQWDERWGHMSYGDSSIIAVSGCGPTALSMVVVGLTHDQTATPAQIASYAMEQGYYTEGTGTSWNLMTEGAAAYGLQSQKAAVEQKTMEQSLKDGKLLICSMRAGDFTTAGHFIVLYDYDETGFKVNDPFCIYRSQKTWDFATLKQQIKSMWILKKQRGA